MGLRLEVGRLESKGRVLILVSCSRFSGEREIMTVKSGSLMDGRVFYP